MNEGRNEFRVPCSGSELQLLLDGLRRAGARDVKQLGKQVGAVEFQRLRPVSGGRGENKDPAISQADMRLEFRPAACTHDPSSRGGRARATDLCRWPGDEVRHWKKLMVES